MRRLARSLLMLATVGAMLATAVPAHAAAGDLDPLFGNGGRVITDMGMDEHGYAVAVQSDGKVVVVGDRGNVVTGGSTEDFAVVRYSFFGTLDTTFGGGDGKVLTGFGGYDAAQAVAIRSNGRIVVGGYSGGKFAIAQYLSNGTLDTSFGGGDGKVTTSFSQGGAEIRSLAIQSNGKIVAAGDVSNTNDYDFALARYTSAGVLDTSFSGDGKVVTDFGKEEYAYSVGIDPTSGRIVAGGWTGDFAATGNNADFAFARYTTSGALDTTFGSAGTGKVVRGFGGYDTATSMVVTSTGRIIAAGFTDVTGDWDFAVMKLNQDGSLRTQFGGGDGKVITGFGDDEFANGIGVQSDGKIVVGGWRDETSTLYREWAVARYNDDGTLDTTFGGGDGKRLTSVGTYDDDLGTIAIDPSTGDTVQAGYTYNPQGATHDFAAVRYLAS